MRVVMTIIFFTSAFIIVWAMAGYSTTLKLISKFVKKKGLEKDYSYQPSITIMIVAHNEEKVIKYKLNNVLDIDYPIDKTEILVASDNSTDKTNPIVQAFIHEHPERNIRLYEVKERKGKTNAQNEAQKTVTSEILIMTDANAMLDKKAAKELVAAFTSDDISYISGRLKIINKDTNDVADAENTYWDKDTYIRKIESDLQTITAGNGAIYACRNNRYYDFDPIRCHDSNMPRYYALRGERALYNPDAIAYEKAGEVIEDEFKRKVRMNRGILGNILPDIRILNVFKYRWYSFFYFGHRTCRYLLWISHLLIFMSNGFLALSSTMYLIVFVLQLLFYLLALLRLLTNLNNKYISLIYYYTVTIIAQWVGVFNIITGKAKPFWDKAESTR